MVNSPQSFSAEGLRDQYPHSWNVHKIGDVIDVIPTGRTYDAASVKLSGEVPVLHQKAEGFFGFHDEEPGVQANLEKPVLTFSNHRCKLRLMTRPFSTIQNVFAVKGLEGITDTRFLYYALGGRVEPEEYKGYFPTLKSLWIGFPPLEEQKLIADLLGNLDNLFVANNALMDALTELASAMYLKTWDGKSKQTIADLGLITMGQSPLGTDLTLDEVGLPFYQGVRDFGERFPELRVYSKASKRVAHEGDVLIAVRAPVGEVNIAPETVVIGRGLAALNSPTPALAFRALTADPQTWIPYQGAGTVFSSITGPELKQVMVPEVSDPILETELSQLDQLYFQLHLENQALANSRNTLLPLLLSGVITVKKAGLS